MGALAKAELDGEPGERILRLRTALSGPLGALGDQLFWAGIVPATMGLALIATAMGFGLGAVAIGVVAYNVFRVLVTWWGLRVGLAHGLRVAHAISQSWLPRAAPRATSRRCWWARRCRWWRPGCSGAPASRSGPRCWWWPARPCWAR